MIHSTSPFILNWTKPRIAESAAKAESTAAPRRLLSFHSSSMARP